MQKVLQVLDHIIGYDFLYRIVMVTIQLDMESFYFIPSILYLYNKLSRSAMTTIDPQIRARHERAPISQHVHCRRLEVLRSSQTAEQSTPHPNLLDLRLLLKQLVGHSGADVLFELASVCLFENLWGWGLLRQREC